MQIVHLALSEMGADGSPLDHAKYAECVGKTTCAIAQDTASQKTTPLTLRTETLAKQVQL